MCGGPLSHLSKLNICRKTPECREAAKRVNDKLYYERHREQRAARKIVKGTNEVRVTPGQCVFWLCTEDALFLDRFCHEHLLDMAPDLFVDGSCLLCGGEIDERSVTGICSRLPECRSAAQSLRNTERRKDYAPSDGWTLPEVCDLDTGEKIVDDIAIEAAVNGYRKVRLTMTEQQIVISRMLVRHHTLSEMARSLGTKAAKVVLMLDEMGYEVVEDNLRWGKKVQSSKVIVPKTRRRSPGSMPRAA